MPVQFHQFTVDEFELALDRFADWQRVNDPNAEELVYEIDTPDEERAIRIYSSIDPNSAKARTKGSDAIRIVMWSRKHECPLGGEKHTRRNMMDNGEIRWAPIMEKKVSKLIANWRDYSHSCHECDSHMAYREGKYGPFVSCLGRDCEVTMSL